MRSLFVILVLIGLISCTRDTSSECFQYYGGVTEELRELPGIIQIDLYDIFNIYLIQDTVNELTIKTGDQLLDDIETRVAGKRLYIYNHSRCRWLRKYDRPELYLRFMDIECLRLWEPCRVVTLKPITKPYFKIYSFAKLFEGDIELNNDYFDFGVNFACNGNTKISGSVHQVSLMNRGVHLLLADSLVSSSADITNISRGDMWIGNCDTLAVRILLSGNVYYRGDPEIIYSEINSAGKLIRVKN
jgi:hypothetical protein